MHRVEGAAKYTNRSGTGTRFCKPFTSIQPDRARFTEKPEKAVQGLPGIPGCTALALAVDQRQRPE